MFDINAHDTLEILKPMAQWLHDHALLAGLLTCFVSLLESLAIIGYLIPGSIIMPAIGVLVGAGILPAADIFFWAILGAVLGDGLSFWLGYHYHESLREMWPMRNYPSLLQRTEIFFAKHGGKSVFIGRFMGAVRPMVPVVAGMMNMNPWRFYTANFLSALIWAPAFLLPGIILGAASLELPAKVATEFLLVLFTLLILLWLLMWLLKWALHRLQHHTIVILNKMWLFMHRHPSIRPLCKLIRDPTQPYKHGQFSLSLLFIGSLIAFWCLLSLPLAHPEELAINQAVDYLFKGLRHPEWDHILAWFSLTAYRKVVLVGVIVVSAWLWWRGHRVAAYHLIAICVVSFLAVAEFKYLVQGSRPPNIGSVTPRDKISYGFPSGHSTLAVVIYGFLTLMMTRAWPKTWKKQLAYAALVLFILASMTTRLYLGAHWFTDVIGGLVLGTCILSITALSYRRFPVQSFSGNHIASLALACISSAMVFYGFSKPHHVSQYQFIPPKTQLTTQQWWHQANNAKPYYLRNRVGRIQSVINIQWLGNLSDIETTLKDLGWQKTPETTWIDLVQRLSPRLDESQLPLISPQYQYQNPALEMMKPASNGDPIQLIHIWPSNIEMSNQPQSLWFGQIEYYVPTHHLILKRNKMKNLATPEGWLELKTSIPLNRQRALTYAALPKGLLKRGIDNEVLLINENLKI